MSNQQQSEPYDVGNIFTYHPPSASQTRRYGQLRHVAKYLANQILLLTPPSRERSLALTNLEQAIFWANAAIARNEQSEEKE